jgi:hypothetical protein
MPLRIPHLLLLLVVLCWPATAALAQPAGAKVEKKRRPKRPSPAVIAEARRRFMRANQLYRLGNYQEALLIYQAALDLHQEPVILYNMAQTYEKLREPAMAALFFDRYLKLRPKAGDRKAVLRRIKSLKRQAKLSVDVTSYPPGAAIYVGSRAGGVKGRTPFELKLPLGKQKIILELSGFLPEERTIEVRLDQRNLVDVQLRRRSSIKVSSDVPGATVYIAGDEPREHHRTPHLFEVEPGRYPIAVELEGYHPVKRQVEVESGEQISLLVNLKPLPRYGQVQIEGEAGAQVLVEGRTFSHLPMQPKPIPVGNHSVSVTREGYRTWEGKLTVLPDRLTVARVKLSPIRGPVTQGIIYGSAGLSAAALVTGGVFGFLALSTERNFRGGPNPELQRSGSTQALTADILFGVSAALAMTSVVTWAVTRRGPSTGELSYSDVQPPPAPPPGVVQKPPDSKRAEAGP